MNRTRVLLTRPDGFNAPLAAALVHRGYSVIERPLMTVETLPDSASMRQVTMNLDHYDAIVLISRNAVIHGVPRLQTYWPQWPERLMWCAVGEQTAKELRQFDIEAVYPPKAGSIGLIETVDRAGGWQGIERVLVVRGKGGLELLRDSLTRRGIQVDYLEVYERAPRYWPSLTDELSQVGVVIVSAGEVIETLCQALNESAIAKLSVVVPSARVADIAKAKGIRTVVVAKDQKDDTLVSAVKDIFEQSR